jgi:hypothetical protein
MGATSVTGTGKGAAFNNKGPHNGRDQFVPLLSPHVVVAGTVTLANGTATVTFPVALAGAPANYVVIATGTTGATTVAVTKTGSTTFVSFTIAGANVAHDYMVCTVGHGA